MPEVDIQLNKWIGCCICAGDDELKKQALSSIEKKKFHAQGGSVYSLYPSAGFGEAVSFIVAFQTISDYLDNLSDRAGVTDEAAFRELHQAMFDAVSPTGALHDYYNSYPYKSDGAYLERLVEACRLSIGKLPAFSKVSGTVLKYVRLYSDLQTYKHLELNRREKILKKWAEACLDEYPGIRWWEISAAAGSTLGIFLLISAANNPEFSENDVDLMDKAYFPWVCGLHILLDYFIDSEEDLKSGDLNFTAYYESARQCRERMAFFIERAFRECASLPHPEFHYTVIRGLLAMYLSDPKAASGIKKITSRNLLKKGGSRALIYFHLCRLLRRMNKL
ncbi:MAG: tetraprenyl-beta-curcumene synthase family protein [Ruminiclostridium sp.]|nr:tetraprenyl-beta-curcumene synthase family protein [Ruminiclostridium sp.]